MGKQGAKPVAWRLTRCVGLMLSVGVIGVGIVAQTEATAGEEPQKAVALLQAGERLYAEHCVKCHGEAGEGNGQLAPWLVVEPPNLTVLSRLNGGEFPFSEVLARIDGTQEVAGHGTSDMPVWRQVFRLQDPDAGAEEIEEKLRSLTAFVRSLQRL